MHNETVIHRYRFKNFGTMVISWPISELYFQTKWFVFMFLYHFFLSSVYRLKICQHHHFGNGTNTLSQLLGRSILFFTLLFVVGVHFWILKHVQQLKKKDTYVMEEAHWYAQPRQMTFIWNATSFVVNKMWNKLAFVIWLPISQMTNYFVFFYLLFVLME